MSDFLTGVRCIGMLAEPPVDGGLLLSVPVTIGDARRGATDAALDNFRLMILTIRSRLPQSDCMPVGRSSVPCDIGCPTTPAHGRSLVA